MTQRQADPQSDDLGSTAAALAVPKNYPCLVMPLCMFPDCRHDPDSYREHEDVKVRDCRLKAAGSIAISMRL